MLSVVAYVDRLCNWASAHFPVSHFTDVLYCDTSDDIHVAASLPCLIHPHQIVTWQVRHLRVRRKHEYPSAGHCTRSVPYARQRRHPPQGTAHLRGETYLGVARPCR